MNKQIVLNLGKGNLQQGFSAVIAQLWLTDVSTPMQFTAGLPAAPKLENLYQRWQQLYTALYGSLGWRSQQIEGFEIEEEDVTHISQAEFEKLSQELKNSLNDWLNASTFLNIDRKLRTQLTPTDNIRLMITAESDQVLKLPWCLWDFLIDYPQAEIALTPIDYTRSIKTVTKNPQGKVRILAILGDRQRIDIETDQKLLQQLPNAKLKFLIEPSRTELTEQLWESGWDILFFAGHSTSQGKGQIQINPTSSLTIDQLRYGLQKAIAQGLKLAIFNSCDGLGLARDLADLHLPQVIVMREPVPDKIAQEFLKHFLTTFARGQSLYSAVREAREKLQSLEGDFPCATWLPVICQNPAEAPVYWQELRGRRIIQLPKPNWRQLPIVFISSLLTTILIVLLRNLNIIQTLEFHAYDTLMQLRPDSGPDPRLLIVTITEEDIQLQGAEPRLGSLSDKHLNLLLTKLEQHQPQIIGLDIYRDFAVSSNQQELVKRMQQSSLIAICKSTDTEQDPTGIAPPPEIPSARLGFSDFVEDSDGVLRRHLLQLSPDPASPCTTDKAFNVQLAFNYLKAQGIKAEFTSQGNIKLGNTTFPSLKSPTLGYQPVDTNGIQLLLNYRSSPRNIAQQVTLNQILSGQINPSAIKDKIILIGVTSASSGDYWSTPYGRGFAQRTPGVFLQAQMVSQLISAALDKRPLLSVLPQWGEFCWIWVWSLTGGLITWYFHRNSLIIITLTITVGTLTLTCFVLLIQGCYLPLVPPILTLVVSSSQVYYLIKKHKS